MLGGTPTSSVKRVLKVPSDEHPTAKQTSVTLRSPRRSNAIARSIRRVIRYPYGDSPKASLNSRLRCPADMCAPRASASTSSGCAYSRSIRSRTRRSSARSRRCCAAAGLLVIRAFYPSGTSARAGRGGSMPGWTEHLMLWSCFGLVAGRDEQADEGVGEPVLVAVGRPSLLDDEPVVDARVDEQPEDGGGLGWCEIWLERAAVGEGLGDRPHAADALGPAVFGERADVGVEPGGGLDDLVEGGGPRAGLADIVGVPGEDAPGVGFVLQRGLDVWALENGHRLVVAGDGPVDGELERLGLAADGGEDGLAAHAGGFGDGVDGGRTVAALGEQACGGVDDGAAGGAGLRRAQRGGVGLLDRCGHFG